MRVLEKHGKVDTRVKKRGVELQNQVVDLSLVTKRDFFSPIYIALEVSFLQKSMVKAFKCTGLSPFEPEKVLFPFQHKHPTTTTACGE